MTRWSKYSQMEGPWPRRPGPGFGGRGSCSCSCGDSRVPPRARCTDLHEPFRTDGIRGPSATVVGVCEAKLTLADASPPSIRQISSSASVAGEFALVAGSDWHDRCLTHRDFCENRLVDVKVRPDELVGGERQQLAEPQLLHAI